ncbi:MAG: crossover junction endodeoxyribonuclease RuvC [Vicinamibacteria bacterium]
MKGRRRYALGIDPGTCFCGYALVEAAGPSTFEPVELGTIVLPESDPIHKRLGRLLRELSPIVERAKEVRADGAVEEPMVFGSHASTIGIASARGVCIALLGAAGLRFSQYKPNVWRKVTGNGYSDKIRTAYIVQTILRLKQTPALDAAEAGAIALYHLTLDP